MDARAGALPRHRNGLAAEVLRLDGLRPQIVAELALHFTDQVAEYGTVLADALQYAHELGFIHRDLKPDNILFKPGRPLVIADCGLRYFVHRESVVLQQLTHGRMGMEYYCSSEQWTTGGCDGRGDIYSLGMTLDEWVTGYQRSISVGMGVVSDTTSDANIGARRFNALLQAMTRTARQQRPPSMRSVAIELRAAAQAT